MEPTTLTLEQAFQNLVETAKDFRGTLKDHQAIQDSLNMVRNALFNQDKRAPEDKPHVLKPLIPEHRPPHGERANGKHKGSRTST